MATNLTSTTFANTYKDDFADSDNYHRILFNSGRALQARELTQLQTIIQAEIGRFARNIFNEGAVVNPGGMTVDNHYEYIKLNEASNTLADNLPTVGEEWYTTPAQDIKFRVLRIEEADTVTGDPATLYVQYTYTKDATSGATAIRVADGAAITNGSSTLDAAASSATGVGTLASVTKGEYFTKNHFVFAAQQSFLLSKYSSTPTADVGFKVTEDIVTTSDTTALYDNQGAAPNTASPGADRYRITLTLTSRDLVDSDENFVFVARVVDGKISIQSDGFSEYNKINDAMALRTKEESGDYVVKAFKAKVEDLNDSNLRVVVSPGVAYVDGYRLETPLTRLTVPKAQDTITITGKNSVAQYGNFILQDSNGGNAGLPNINTFDQVNLRDSVQYGGSTIGTARVRAVERYGSDIRHYLFDIQMNTGATFTSVQSFGESAGDYVDVKLTDGVAVLQETGNNSLLFPLAHTRPTASGVTVNSLTVQRRYEFTSDGTGNYSLSAGSFGTSSLTFTDTGDWTITKLNSSVSSESVTFTPAGSPVGTTVNIAGMTADTVYELIAYVDVSSPTSRPKSLDTATVTKMWPDSADSDGAGLAWITLPNTDIFDIRRLSITDSDGADLSGNFNFDNGQRDNFYARGRLIKKAGISVPTGDVYVKYRYFSHDPGHFFSVNSYSGISYGDIPSHRKNNGEVVALRDVLDFRSAVDSYGNFQDNNNYITLLPKNTDTIDVDADYYLPRKDKLVVRSVESAVKTNRAEVKYIQGVSSFDPVEPSLPTGSMLLYKYSLNAYTLNDSDLTSEFINNKGYTMRDIGKIEKRIDNLEELTTLNLLETNTANVLVLDSAGNPRTKSGFLADNFNSQAFSELGPRYRASIDQAENTLNPPFISKNIRLLYDSSYGLNSVTRTGDLITLPYTHSALINQNLATETMNINPFAVITQTGYMVLSPSSDEWVETLYTADNIISGNTRSNVNANQLRQALRNGWTGSSGQLVIRSDSVVRELVNDRVVDVQILPWMRSKKVAFKAIGMRPDTQFFPYFNGTAVDVWCNDDSFSRFALSTTDYGNRYANATQHPDGTTDLISNAEGIVEGTFFIPSTSSTRFRTGPAEFKLLDVTGGSDASAVSTARAQFTSSGVLETRQRTVRSTRVVQVGRAPEVNVGFSDPLAQSFLVDRIANPNGMFLTKVEVYFSSKDTTIPVTCQIVTVENGTPTEDVLPGASVTLLPSSVTVDTSNDMDTLRGNGTQFTFEEPVYLSPGRQYAFVLKSECTSYNVYVAKTYDFVLGTTSARVNKQPTLGSLFQSQNSSTWTADQTRDMMFKLYRAEFSSSGIAYLENGAPPFELLGTNPLRVDSGDSDVTFSLQGHGFMYGDRVRVILPSGFADSFGGIADSAIGGDSEGSTTGLRTINAVDWTGFKVGAVSSLGSTTATSTLVGGGSGIVVEQQAMFDEFIPVIQILQPEETTISASAQFTGGGSYAGTRNSSSLSGRSKASTFSSITLNEVNYNESPKVIMTPTNETKFLSGSKSATIKIDLATTDTKVSPVIDLQRSSLILTENVIDKQDSAATSGYNVPLNFVAETDPTEGTIAAKHVTKQIALQEPAVGLKVLLSANRPTDASIQVYYKTGTGDDVLDDKAWTEVSAEATLPGDNDRTTYREYEYLAGGTGGTLASFTTYQVKVVMTSTNSSRSPKIKDLRVIALAT